MNPSLPSPEFLDRMAAAFATLGRLHLRVPRSRQPLDQSAKLLDEWPIEDEGDTAFGLKELRASLAGEGRGRADPPRPQPPDRRDGRGAPPTSPCTVTVTV